MDSIETHELLQGLKSRPKRPAIREIVIVHHRDHANYMGFNQEGAFCH